MIRLLVVTFVLIVCFQNCGKAFSSDQLSRFGAAGTASGPTQYLIFQDFTSANNGSGVLVQGTSDQTQLKKDLSGYVSQIQSKLQPGSFRGVTNRQYGFSIGPLALDQSDQELSATIKTAFDVAIERNVAVSLHFDTTHFWKNAKNADGTLLSNGTGAQDSREWKDWAGTIADKDPWDGEPNIMPSMCFECAQVKALVDRVAGSAIAPAIKAGLDRLASLKKPELFAGVIVGWEAGSLNSLGYHSLSLKGYSAASSLADLNKAQQQILHDYMQRWSQQLVNRGIPREKIYTHTANKTSWNLNEMEPFISEKNYFGAGYTDHLLQTLGVGPDSFWMSFNDYANAGFSVYVNSVAEGCFEAIWAEAAQHSGTWAEAEGTNVMIDGKPSPISWESYLAKIYNHGGSMANLFGGFLGASAGGYATSTESQEAVAAYRKFLSGKPLNE